jgi:hypothetical protein
VRTTLSLDDDVSALLDRIRKEQDRPLRDIVNEALRHGLERIAEPPKPHKRYRTRPISVGKARLENFDCVAEILDMLERNELP